MERISRAGTVDAARSRGGGRRRSALGRPIAVLVVLAALAFAAPAAATMRVALYEPEYPEAWPAQLALAPTLGAYDSTDLPLVRWHQRWLEWSKLDAVASWDGPGSLSDSRMPALISLSFKTSVQWALRYRPEALSDPPPEEISALLAYVSEDYTSHSSFLREGGKPVMFVATGPLDGCGAVERWTTANAGTFHLAMETFPGFALCQSQPDRWYARTSGAEPSAHVPGHSYTITPGRWAAGEPAPSLERPLPRGWRQVVQGMLDSGEPLQVVDSFNDWAAGTSIESAEQWVHPNCIVYGRRCPGYFLNRLHWQVPDPTVAVAGDIACDPDDASFNGGEGTVDRCRHKHTAALIDTDYVLTLGDQQYESGRLDDFMQSYDPTWGAFKHVTYPTVGNHEAGGDGYWDYFGSRAGERGRGWYSLDIGDWHVIALNSNCSRVSCPEQEAWLRADLAGNRERCTLAFWHHPHFTDGTHGPDDDGSTAGFWSILDEAEAELVLSGHDHNYQRFAPMRADGTPAADGVVQFISGGGGKNLHVMSSRNDAVARHVGFGVLKLTLHPEAYSWEFVPDGPSDFTDSGTAACV